MQTQKKIHWTSLNSLCILVHVIYFSSLKCRFSICYSRISDEGKAIETKKMHYKNSFVAYFLAQ